MDKQQAQTIIKETFEKPFNKDRFNGFIKNLLNQIETASFNYHGNYIPDAYKPFISRYERIGKYNDGEKRIDILIVYLNRKTSIERARTSQRNFIAGYLDGKYGSDVSKDAALVAFVSPNEEDWRFSLVKMDYRFEPGKGGKVKVKEEFTPARRWSFLVGKNESSHTAQSRLVPILTDDQHDPTLAQMEEAFNIEKVTKEFFGKYRELFLWTKETLDKIAERDTKIEADFEAKGVNTVDFAKKLLGQIVFLYFLQKKGWFGVKRDAEWGTGTKQFLRELFQGKHRKYGNFFNDILEPLFYDALSRDRSDIDHWNDQFRCKIPFLNGGLFDPIGNYSWYNTDILLPSELFSNQNKTKEGDIGNGILDIFDRYNFTVKEDEPLEKEVAVDPEMLGKVFENLLEVRDRKSKGSYYTPREIVHYMCQQSLINYLNTELNKGVTLYQDIGDIQTNAFGNEAKVGQLDLTVKHKSGPEITKNDIETLIKYGEQFGENETIALEKERNIADGKQQTTSIEVKLPAGIRKNAKLIDDKLASIKVCDPAIGSGAFPVGMMHEIVRVRDVLSAFIKAPDRTIYNFKRECIEKSLYGVDIDPGAVEIAKLRLWLSLVVDEEDIKQIKPLPNLDYKIVCGNSLLGVEKNLFNHQLFDELERLKPLLFNETNPTQKQSYKQRIDELISQITNGHKEFDFEVYFSEVFHEKKGFDVVIANPPYVQIKQISWSTRKIYENIFKSAVGRFNLFYFFLELSSKIVRVFGTSTFIVPDRLLLNTQCDWLRKWLLKEQTILEIDSFAEGVFDAVVDSIIIIYRNVKSNEDSVKAKGRVPSNLLEQISAIEIPISYFLNSPSNQFDLSYQPSVANLLEKIRSQSKSLGEIGEIKDGIIQSRIGQELFLKKELDEDSKKLLFGKDIIKYRISFNGNWVNYKPDEMMRIELTRVKGAPGLRLRKRQIFERNKILTRQTADGIIAAYDSDNYYYSNTLHGTTIIDNDYHAHYVLALLNSTLMTWYYRSTTAEEGKVFAQIKIKLLRLLPIKKASNIAAQQPFITLVDRILDMTKDEDYLQNPQKQSQVKVLEQEIDQMVYQLYGLTEEEIRIVEKS